MQGCPIQKLQSFIPACKRGACFWALQVMWAMLAFPIHARAADPAPYEEITVFVSMSHVGRMEMPALIRDQDIYLPVSGVFRFLKINHAVSATADSISGFFVSEQTRYLINNTTHQVRLNHQLFTLSEQALVKAGGELYLRLDAYGTVFGLNGTFSFRNLSVTLSTSIELPVIRLLRQEQLRQNLKKVKGEVHADTVIPRRRAFFQPGVADWSVLSVQNLHDHTTTRMNMKAGALVAGGEATASLVFQSGVPFTQRQQFYQWRYVNNSSPVVRQVLAGKFSAQYTTTMLSPVIGLQLTNRPTQYRRSLGTYTLTDRAEPGWLVELYVNNVLVGDTKVDASGTFTFEVPLLYGATSIKLCFYGPSGEEKTREQNVVIPYTVLPKRVFEYTVNAGVTDDSLHNRIAKASLAYGLGKAITIGSGLEYVPAVVSGAAMPFVNATIRLRPQMLLYSEYIQGVRAKGVFSYRHPSRLQLELQYIKYVVGQKAIRNNFLEERNATVSMPFKMDRASLLSTFTFHQNIACRVGNNPVGPAKFNPLLKRKTTMAELMLSVNTRRISASLATIARVDENTRHDVYSNLLIGYRLGKDLSLRPQVQYNYTDASLRYMKVELEKKVMRNGYATVSFERNTGSSTFTAGVRVNLSYARTALTAVVNGHSATLLQAASGSVHYDAKTGTVHAGNTTSVGRGGLIVQAFLDMNCNGKKEQDEPWLPGIKCRINGGRVLPSAGDKVSVVNLEPYQSYLVQVDENSFGNIAWHIQNRNIRVTVVPNIFTKVDVPVAVQGEASGLVTISNGNEQRGISRVLVNFYDSTARLVAQTMTERDGYFSFMGFAPGRYTARVDSVQLQKLHLTSLPDSICFRIARSEEGVIADGFSFTLHAQDDQTGAGDAQQVKRATPLWLPSARPPAPPVDIPASNGNGNPQVVTTNTATGMPPVKLKTGKPGRIPTQMGNGMVAKPPAMVDTLNRQVPQGQHLHTRMAAPRVTRVHPVIRKKKVAPQGNAITRQQLLQKNKTLATKEGMLFSQLEQLLAEQRRLIEVQRKLLREIQQLRRMQKR